jgi:predicted MFS family arabinose efflux permease
VSPFRLATAGIGIVGVSFGMARYGYGLLLPDIRHTYGLSSATLGLFGTGAYVAYLAATALTGAFAAKAGPRNTAVGAGLLATLGMVVAGLSRSPAALAAGIVIGGAAAALAFAPFSDAVAGIREDARARTLSAINCGTGYGVALAAPLAILLGANWRGAWLAFAAVALVATAWAARVLPKGGNAGKPAYGWREAVCPRSVPLFASGVLIGLGSAAYWTFAVEHVTDAGGLDPSAARLFLGAVGVAGVLATLTGDVVNRVGARGAFVAATTLEAAGIALLAAAPGATAAAFGSALLFGAAYNAAVAVQSIWAVHVFAERPSLGLSAAMAANGLGLTLGPLGAGLLAGPLGTGAVLALGAALVAAAGTFAPREEITPARSRGARAAPRSA